MIAGKLLWEYAFSVSSPSSCAQWFKKLLLNTKDMPLPIIHLTTVVMEMPMEHTEPMVLMEDTVLDLLMLDIMEREKLDLDHPRTISKLF
ncbi:hypothetical protein B9Z55_019524 [Caenorhabditis nigoni]|uniref:Uncharacterized protein n=1 Tax=Caenorhabditis nigoni TaxID=1611254 RepID=A0A2G5TIW6_9PELO|nr:hypothetical protein B9Z55_019524 [Caenorhabditis nigoni]